MAEAIIRINGRQVTNTFRAINREVKKLEEELKGATFGSEEFIKKAQEVKQARAAFEKVKNEINAVRFATQKTNGIIGKFSKFMGEIGVSIIKTFALSNLWGGFNSKISQTADDLLKIADAMSAVKKTTGLSQEKVRELWNDFDELNTRTQKIELLKISSIAGRLGISDKDEIAEFTQEIDKAYVALGDSFSGGLEAVAERLGKIKTLFSDTKEMSYAEAIKRVGSALNDLAADGTASEENISDFALRMGRLPEALRPGTSQVLGLGAAFEESGIDAQIAASGYARFITVAAQNIEQFAKAMNMGKEEAQELINTRPDEFFLRFSAGMKGLEATTAANIFKNLKINTQEVQSVIGAAEQNTARFTDTMNNAALSMAEMTSLENEFNEVNNNAAAIWQKIKNTIDDFFTSGEFLDSFEWWIQLLGDLVGVTEDAEGRGKRLRNILELIWKWVKLTTTAWLAYNVGLKLNVAWTNKSVIASRIEILQKKANVIWTNTLKAVVLLAAYAQALFARNTTRARAAVKLFTKTIRKNPLGLLLSLLASAISYLVYFRDELDKTTESLTAQEAAAKSLAKAQSDIGKAGASAADKLRNSIDPLVRILQSEYTTLDMRKRAYNELIEISDVFKGKVDDEFRATEALSLAYKNLADQTIKLAEARGIRKIVEEKSEELARAKADAYQAQLAADREKDENEKLSKTKRTIINTGQPMFGGYNSVGESGSAYVKEFYESTEKAEALAEANKKVRNIEAEKLELKGLQNKEMDKLLARMEIVKALSGEQSEAYKKLEEQLTAMAGIQPVSYDPDQNTDPGGGGNNTPNRDPGAVARKQIEQNEKEILRLNKKYAQEARAAEREAWDAKHKFDEENYDNDLAYLKEHHRRELEDLDLKIEDELSKEKELQEKIKNLEVKKKEDPENAAKYDNLIINYQTAQTELNHILTTNQEIRLTLVDTYKKQEATLREKYDLKHYTQIQTKEQTKLNQAQTNMEYELTQIKTLEEAKMQLREVLGDRANEEELAKIADLEKAKSILRKAATEKAISEMITTLNTQISVMESAVSTLTGKAKENMMAAITEMKNKVVELNLKINGDDEEGEVDSSLGEASGVDVLGFSAEQWDETFKNLDTTEGKLSAIGKAFQAMANLSKMFSDLQAAQNERELKNYTANQKKQKKALLDKLNTGLISQSQYTTSVEKMDKDLANKKAEMEYKQAKADKTQRLFSAIGNTAVAISNALGAPFPLNIALPIIVGALGAIQIAAIASQPLPAKTAYASGGFTTGIGFSDETGHEVAGVVHANEYVVPEWMRKDPVVANVVDWLEAKRTGKETGFANGGATEDTEGAPLSSIEQDSLEQNEYNQLMYGAMLRLSENLEKLDQKGVQAYVVADEQVGKDMSKAIKKYNRIKSKNKK